MTPQRVLGEEMEPRVSDPIVNATQPADVAEAGPAEEPLEPCLGFQGLRVRPPNQTSPMARAPRVSLAMSTAPAASRRWDDGRVFIDGLMLEDAGSPGGGVALDGEQIFGAPGESVKRAAVFALCSARGRRLRGRRHGKHAWHRGECPHQPHQFVRTDFEQTLHC